MGDRDTLGGPSALPVFRRPVTSRMAVGGLIACVAMGTTAYWLFAKDAGADRQPNLMCVSTGCGYRATRRLRVGEILPLRCPRCEERSVYGTHLCGGWGTAVVLNRQRGIDMPTYCPKCKAEVRRGR